MSDRHFMLDGVSHPLGLAACRSKLCGPTVYGRACARCDRFTVHVQPTFGDDMIACEECDFCDAEFIQNDIHALIFDTETTGVDPQNSEILELAIRYGVREPNHGPRTWRFKPRGPIPASATAIHGITDAQLADCRPFCDFAEGIRATISAATVIIGYNVRFDLEMLDAELARCKLEPINLTGIQVVDPFRLWQSREPRTLSDAYARFVGGEHEAAHDAAGDVEATARVLAGMVRAFGLIGSTWAELADAAEPDRKRWIGPSPHVQWIEGVATVAFGKHKGTALAETPEGFLRWAVAKDFPRHVVAIFQHAIKLRARELDAWIVASFGAPPT